MQTYIQSMTNTCIAHVALCFSICTTSNFLVNSFAQSNLSRSLSTPMAVTAAPAPAP